MLMVDLSVSAGDCAARDRASRGMLAAKATVELRKVRRVGCGGVEFTGDSPELGWWPTGEAYHLPEVWIFASRKLPTHLG